MSSKTWRLAEASILGLIIYAHWYPDPIRINSLLLFLPLLAIRYAFSKRLVTHSPLDVFLVVFVGLCLLNLVAAPYTWGFYVVSRAALGAGIVWAVADWGRSPQVDGAFAIFWLLFGILIGAISLVTAQYTIKSLELQNIINLLPKLRDLPVVTGGFNVNEISGAMSLLLPPAVALALTQKTALRRGLRVGAWAAVIVLSFALLLAQSRLAIIGVFAASAVILFAVMRPGARRRLALAILVALAVIELIVAGNWFVPASSANVAYLRDEGSQLARFEIWSAGLGVIRDHPLAGVGINQFRSRAVRADYPVPGYETAVLPHAHNILLQTGADLGLPGIAVYVGWTIALAIMLRRLWKQGDAWAKTCAVGAAGGLLAHLVFNSADAIPLFDRFIFLYWLLVGWSAALYVRMRKQGSG
ncbi:MAG: O-antigen ligase family protein [Chloroflexi bacterium]|nr:O-antigen ligase family protein [Chloroflexota bacterium]